MSDQSLSVVIPCYNEEATIEQIVAVVLQADTLGLNLDIIIVDDASTDNTHEIAKSFAISDPRIRIIKNDYNQGAYA